ncbi:MAG TPA: hypothetical protein VFR09_06655 [Alphaproteobacteria bacterium]|nr:hypothetical protein [Alphaproteobacteria bacterium]
MPKFLSALLKRFPVLAAPLAALSVGAVAHAETAAPDAATLNAGVTGPVAASTTSGTQVQAPNTVAIAHTAQVSQTTAVAAVDASTTQNNPGAVATAVNAPASQPEVNLPEKTIALINGPDHETMVVTQDIFPKLKLHKGEVAPIVMHFRSDVPSPEIAASHRYVREATYTRTTDGSETVVLEALNVAGANTDTHAEIDVQANDGSLMVVNATTSSYAPFMTQSNSAINARINNDSEAMAGYILQTARNKGHVPKIKPPKQPVHLPFVLRLATAPFHIAANVAIGLGNVVTYPFRNHSDVVPLVISDNSVSSVWLVNQKPDFLNPTSAAVVNPPTPAAAVVAPAPVAASSSVTIANAGTLDTSRQPVQVAVNPNNVTMNAPVLNQGAGVPPAGGKGTPANASPTNDAPLFAAGPLARQTAGHPGSAGVVRQADNTHNTALARATGNHTRTRLASTSTTTAKKPNPQTTVASIAAPGTGTSTTAPAAGNSSASAQQTGKGTPVNQSANLQPVGKGAIAVVAAGSSARIAADATTATVGTPQAFPTPDEQQKNVLGLLAIAVATIVAGAGLAKLGEWQDTQKKKWVALPTANDDNESETPDYRFPPLEPVAEPEVLAEVEPQVTFEAAPEIAVQEDQPLVVMPHGDLGEPLRIEESANGGITRHMPSPIGHLDSRPVLAPETVNPLVAMWVEARDAFKRGDRAAAADGILQIMQLGGADQDINDTSPRGMFARLDMVEKISRKLDKLFAEPTRTAATDANVQNGGKIINLAEHRVA